MNATLSQRARLIFEDIIKGYMKTGDKQGLDSDDMDYLMDMARDRAGEAKEDNPFARGGHLYPVVGLFSPGIPLTIDSELETKIKAIGPELETKIDKRLKDNRDKQLGQVVFYPREGRRGFCFLYWGIKKEILKEDYGIDWKTPKELNPLVFFD